MHDEARYFTLYIKHFFKNFFNVKRALDVGSGDINGNNRFLFDDTETEYHGNDVFAARNVTIVSPTSKLPFPDEYFDTIVSTECFEHDPEYALSWKKIYSMLKAGGLFFFTCAGDNRPEHGTRRTSPSESYGTIGNIDGWPDYYKNLNLTHLKEVFNLDKDFSSWKAYYNSASKDLYFWGIKSPRSDISKIGYIPPYTQFVQNVVELGGNLFGLGDNKVVDNITNIFNRYNTDKNESYNNYGRQYDKILKEYRNKPIKFLELGVFKGESLKAWRDVFPEASCILGIDIDNSFKHYENKDKKIFIEIGDLTNKDFVDDFNKKYGGFDIIIDDRNNRNDTMIKTFELLFPLLNDNGIYIIEDTCCWKSPNHTNSQYPNHLEYFTQFIPGLNQTRVDDSNEGPKDHCADPFKIVKKTSDVFEYSIDSIHYGVSFIAVEKKVRKHWIP